MKPECRGVYINNAYIIIFCLKHSMYVIGLLPLVWREKLLKKVDGLNGHIERVVEWKFSNYLQ